MKNQAKMFQTKEQDAAPETDYNERELHDLPDTEFKITLVKMLTEVKGTMHEQSENFNEENFNEKIENVKNYQTEIMELKK